MRHFLRAVSLWWLIVLVPIMAGAAARNERPIAKNDAATTPVDTSVTINVTANDSDRDGRIARKTVRIVGRGPLDGTVVKRRNGRVTYTPDPGFAGQDTFRYRVKDNRGALSNRARVRVAVGISPPPPVITSITNDNTPTVSGTAATGITEVTLYQNDTPVPVPPAVSVMIDGAWSYTYTTVILPRGVHTFTATGKNADGQESSRSAARTVRVRKTGPTDPSINPRQGCNVTANPLTSPPTFTGLLPPLEGVEPCLQIDPTAGGIPVRVIVQKVEFDDPSTPTKTGPIHTYDDFSVSGDILRVDIKDGLPGGSYHLKFFVRDVAGNESCTETFIIAAENTGCGTNIFEGNPSPVYLIIFEPQP